MPMTANRELSFYPTYDGVDIGVDANANIYKGALVGRNRSTGYARPLVAGDEFLGVAYRQANNTLPGNTAGGINVRLHQAIDVVAPVSAVATGDIGREVFASADDTLTLTPSGNSRVGRVVAIESSGVARVRCQPLPSLSGAYENLSVVVLADASATLTLDQINRVLLIGNTAARTLTLPAAATVRAGAWIRVVKTSSAAFAVTIDPNASETVDGASTLATVDAIYDVAHFLCTGSEWIVLSRDIS